MRFGVCVKNLPLDDPRECGPAGFRRGGWRAAVVGTLLAAASVSLTACDNPVYVRGHVTDLESVEAIKAGQYTQDDVLALLGTPSTVSTFDEQKWYYIGHKSTKFAFERPDIFERNVLVLSFDDSGFVRDKRIYSLTDGRNIDPVPRETPTEGRDFTVLQQLLGNLGRLPGSGTEGVPDLPGP